MPHVHPTPADITFEILNEVMEAMHKYDRETGRISPFVQVVEAVRRGRTIANRKHAERTGQ